MKNISSNVKILLAILFAAVSFFFSGCNVNLPFPAIVDNTSDDASLSACKFDVPNDCSLRGAIIWGQQRAAPVLIVFDDDVFNSPKTITLNGSPLVISHYKPFYINGPGADKLTVSGNNQSRVFELRSAFDPNLDPNAPYDPEVSMIVISGIRITGGNGGSDGKGGAILTDREDARKDLFVGLNKTIVTGNIAGEGGAIYNNESLAIYDSAITNNIANVDGGAIYNRWAMKIQNSTVSGNSVSVNDFPKGCGIATTLRRGGGQNTNVEIKNATITDNNCGGFATFNSAGLSINNGSVTIGSSIITGNTLPDVRVGGGSLVSEGYNLIGSRGATAAFDKPGDQTGTNGAPLDAKLSPLGNFGGSTPTRVPQPDSPAIDKGKMFVVDLNFAQSEPAKDQRERPRPYDNPLIAPADGGDNSDIGAVEVQAVTGMPNSADLLPDSDSGVSGTDNITNVLSPSFEITNTTNAAIVQLYRGELLVASVEATGETTVLTDGGAPPGTFQYKSRQIINGETYTSAAVQVTIDRTAPLVQSSLRKGEQSVVPGSFVEFNVTFSEPVSTADVSDFSLTTGGDISGASIINVAGTSNVVRTVIASTGSGYGTIALKVVDNDTITDIAGNPLGGVGAGNGDRNGDEAFWSIQPIGATRTVTKIEDTNDGVCDADCSLREAVATAPTNGVILFSGFFEAPRTITINSNANLYGIEINKNLIIFGPGAAKLTVTTLGFSRIFSAMNNNHLQISGMTLTNGNTDILQGSGGAISAANLTLYNCHITNNSSYGGAGGVAAGGDLTIINSTISNNISKRRGNSAGGISVGGAFNLINSTVSGNVSGDIGGSNVAQNAGGIFISSPTAQASIVNSTITNNTVNSETISTAGLLRTATLTASTVLIRNSIIAGNIDNTLKSDTRGAFVSQGYNIIGSLGTGTGFDQPSDKVGNVVEVTDPLLAPLGNYGGSVPTHALLPNSPAIDKGGSSALTTDQRGQPRPFDVASIVPSANGDNSDIGAFEFSPAALSGTIVYAITAEGETPKSVPNVSLNAALASSVVSGSVITDAAGNYLFGDLIGGGDYIATPAKSGNINGINAFDSALVLRCIAAGANCALSNNQRSAADTDGDGSLSAFDATLILRFAAAGNRTANTGTVGNWKFLPVARTYNSISGSRTGENYTAILVGEVSGDWMPANGGNAAPNQ